MEMLPSLRLGIPLVTTSLLTVLLGNPAAQAVETIAALPDGNYRVCSQPPTALPAGQPSGTCFIFTKQGNNVVGLYRESPAAPVSWCLAGTVNQSTISGLASTTGTLPINYLLSSLSPTSEYRQLAPFLKVAEVEVRKFIVNPRQGYALQLVPYGINDSRNQAIDLTGGKEGDKDKQPLLGEIRYRNAVLDLGSFYLYNAGSELPPRTCNPLT
ncbi:hypothetical protein Syn6312_2226 [Synechococcus sp. PCC 6312]|nr:hypothetical protein Syn6312_2226 [Synechococcus sp. PCC 6312]